MSLNATIIAITDEKATVCLEDGQTLVLPLTAIEGTPKQGMAVGVIVVAPGSEDAGRQAFARDLLNTLLSA